MSEFSQAKKDQVWNSARLIDKSTFYNSKIQNDPDEFRMDDMSGAIIKYSDYGKQTEYGWTIDHVLPVSKGGTNDIENLQASHWENNLSKGNDFPVFNVAKALNLNSPFENVDGPFPRITVRQF